MLTFYIQHFKCISNFYFPQFFINYKSINKNIKDVWEVQSGTKVLKITNS